MTIPGVEPVFEVLDGGFLTTVQDAGRPDLGALGVSPGGACDPWSFAVANLRCGNDPDAPALELTLAPPTLRALGPVRVALAGAELGLRIRSGGADVPFPPGASGWLREGDELGPDAAVPSEGARAYLAVEGGFVVPTVLGSASTALGAGFGGHEGRALRAGDVLRARTAGAANGVTLVPPIAGGADNAPSTLPGRHVAVLPGPHAAQLGRDAVDALTAHEWRIASTSDRMGLRVEGGPLPLPAATDVASHGVTWGTIQVPPDGRPLVLLADHQPTGGYPVIGVVPIADRPRLGQLRPGEEISFRIVTREEAVAALRWQRHALDELERACKDAIRWDDRWRSAEG